MTIRRYYVLSAKQLIPVEIVETAKNNILRKSPSHNEVMVVTMLRTESCWITIMSRTLGAQQCEKFFFGLNLFIYI